MTNQTTPQELIEKLGTKDVRKSLEGTRKEYRPILIGDVLEGIRNANLGSEFNNPSTESWYYRKLTELWDDCGFTRSLQDIAGDVEEEIMKKHADSDIYKEEDPVPITFSNPEAKALFTFLTDIFND